MEEMIQALIKRDNITRSKAVAMTNRVISGMKKAAHYNDFERALRAPAMVGLDSDYCGKLFAELA